VLFAPAVPDRFAHDRAEAWVRFATRTRGRPPARLKAAPPFRAAIARSVVRTRRPRATVTVASSATSGNQTSRIEDVLSITTSLRRRRPNDTVDRGDADPCRDSPATRSCCRSPARLPAPPVASAAARLNAFRPSRLDVGAHGHPRSLGELEESQALPTGKACDRGTAARKRSAASVRSTSARSPTVPQRARSRSGPRAARASARRCAAR